MIAQVDQLLRDLLLTVPGLTDDQQIRFQPPDGDWRTFVSGTNQLSLNVYLVELRENRKLRSNERSHLPVNGTVERLVAPARVDAHYLISAWSPAQPAPAVEPTLEEHTLLANVLAVLYNSAPLNPSRIYPPGSAALAAVDPLIRNSDLPTVVAAAEGFPKLAEFWGAMGNNSRWKPVIYLVVTVPVVLENEIAGPIVTTRLTEYRITGVPESSEIWVQIGGHVLDGVETVAQAWVQLETATGEPLQATTSNSAGRFTFLHLQPGSYQLRWRARGQPEPAPRSIEVPSPTGEYDLNF